MLVQRAKVELSGVARPVVHIGKNNASIWPALDESNEDDNVDSFGLNLFRKFEAQIDIAATEGQESK